MLAIEIEAVVESDHTRKLLLRTSDGKLREIGRIPLTVESHGDGDALAHLIVRACNAHAALVEACNETEQFLLSLNLEPDDTETADALLVLVRAALATNTEGTD